jgi:hypothetical protein
MFRYSCHFLVRGYRVLLSVVASEFVWKWMLAGFWGVASRRLKWIVILCHETFDKYKRWQKSGTRTVGVSTCDLSSFCLDRLFWRTSGVTSRTAMRISANMGSVWPEREIKFKADQINKRERERKKRRLKQKAKLLFCVVRSTAWISLTKM